MTLPPRNPAAGTGPRRPPSRTKVQVIVGVGFVIMFFVLIPRWRNAVLCTVGGGRWAKTPDDPYTEVVCRAKSKTAGQACTGQVKGECDRASCDIHKKTSPTQNGGTCPDHYVKYFYTRTGDFFKKQ